jgi:HEAT repeats
MTKGQLEQDRDRLIGLTEQFLGRELALRERNCLESIDSIVSIRFLAERFPRVASEQDFETYFVDYVNYYENPLEYCLRSLDSLDDLVRFQSVDVLRGLATDGIAAISRLCELLRDDPDEQVRAHCAFALADLAEFAPEAVSAIQEALERASCDASDEVRVEVEAALGRIC